MHILLRIVINVKYHRKLSIFTSTIYISLSNGNRRYLTLKYRVNSFRNDSVSVVRISRQKEFYEI